MPRNDSVKWIKKGKNKFIRFQLEDRHYGGCDTDRMKRFGTPYRERAEVMQTNSLKRNTKYELEFTVRFVEGFAGDRETFCQMHAFNKHCKKTFPPLMFKISQGRLLLAALRQGGSGHINYYTNLKINDLLGKWSLFKLKFDTFFKSKFESSAEVQYRELKAGNIWFTAKTSEVSLFVDDKEIISSVPYGLSLIHI